MDDLIYCQRDIPKDRWRYGLRSSAATGCGWIATYNALRLMGCEADPEEIIRELEHQVPLLHGNAGTLALGPYWYFKKHGFQAEHTSCCDHFDEMAKASDVCVLFYYWRRKWKLGAHFVALHHTERGFVSYNTYRNSRGEDLCGSSLEEFLKEKKYFGAVLIGIQKK